jgi:hypothetical protein
MEDRRPRRARGEDHREPYEPPTVMWVEPLGQQAALMVSCGKQPGGGGQCLAEPLS